MKNFIRKLLSWFGKPPKEKAEGKYDFIKDIPSLEVIGQLDIFEVIGKTIFDIRHEYYPLRIDGWMDYSQTYFSIPNDQVIVFPVTGSDTVSIVKQPPEAKKLQKEYEDKITWNHIANIYYEFYEDEPNSGEPSYYVFSNGVVLCEQTIGLGTGMSGLTMYTLEQFNQRVADPEVDIRSVFRIFKDRVLPTHLQIVPELANGLKLLEPFLQQYGFEIDCYQNEKGSGGKSSVATYSNKGKKFSIGYRYSVGLLTYQFENSLVNHSFYLDHLGYKDKKQFPDFQNDDKLLAFRHILQDLDFLVDDFFKGDCEKLKEVAAIHTITK